MCAHWLPFSLRLARYLFIDCNFSVVASALFRCDVGRKKKKKKMRDSLKNNVSVYLQSALCTHPEAFQSIQLHNLWLYFV